MRFVTRHVRNLNHPRGFRTWLRKVASCEPPYRAQPHAGAELKTPRPERGTFRAYSGSLHINHIGGPFSSGTSSTTRKPWRE